MSLPTYFTRVQDEKRTILIDGRHDEMIQEIWEHERRQAGEGLDNSPQIERMISTIDFNSLRDTRVENYKDERYWVIEFPGSSQS